MKLAQFYSDDELSAIRVTNAEDTVVEVKHLFASEQLVEEQIQNTIKQYNNNTPSQVDELRLDFARIYSKKSILSKMRFSRYRFVDSANYKGQFSIETVLAIKSEQRYLSAKFNDYFILESRFGLPKNGKEPYLFATLKNGYFYLLNAEELTSANPLTSTFKKIFSWIQKRISFKTFSK